MVVLVEKEVSLEKEIEGLKREKNEMEIVKSD